MKVRFIKVLDDRSGEGKNGTWRDLQFLVETVEERPKKIALNSKGDAAGKISMMKEGDVFNVSYDIVSNETKDGRWFTKVVVWKVSLEAGDPPTSAYTRSGSVQAQSTMAEPASEEDGSGLPF